MIGRTAPVGHFELVRWARASCREHNLRPLEAHVLLLLASYADDDAKCWPSIRTLAEDAGYQVRARVRRGRTTYECRPIERALARLQELRLIWRKQGGRGHPAISELLFAPSDEAGQHSANGPTTEPGQTADAPSAGTGGAPSAGTGEVPVEEPDRKNQMTPRPGGRGRHLPSDGDSGRAQRVLGPARRNGKVLRAPRRIGQLIGDEVKR